MLNSVVLILLAAVIIGAFFVGKSLCGKLGAKGGGGFTGLSDPSKVIAGWIIPAKAKAWGVDTRFKLKNDAQRKYRDKVMSAMEKRLKKNNIKVPPHKKWDDYGEHKFDKKLKYMCALIKWSEYHGLRTAVPSAVHRHPVWSQYFDQNGFVNDELAFVSGGEWDKYWKPKSSYKTPKGTLTCHEWKIKHDPPKHFKLGGMLGVGNTTVKILKLRWNGIDGNHDYRLEPLIFNSGTGKIKYPGESDWRIEIQVQEDLKNLLQERLRRHGIKFDDGKKYISKWKLKGLYEDAYGIKDFKMDKYNRKRRHYVQYLFHISEANGLPSITKATMARKSEYYKQYFDDEGFSHWGFPLDNESPFKIYEVPKSQFKPRILPKLLCYYDY
jgi:hypothetical protein